MSDPGHEDLLHVSDHQTILRQHTHLEILLTFSFLPSEDPSHLELLARRQRTPESALPYFDFRAILMQQVTSLFKPRRLRISPSVPPSVCCSTVLAFVLTFFILSFRQVEAQPHTHILVDMNNICLQVLLKESIGL